MPRSDDETSQKSLIMKPFVKAEEGEGNHSKDGEQHGLTSLATPLSIPLSTPRKFAPKETHTSTAEHTNHRHRPRAVTAQAIHS